jgi:hypothetical protein
VSDHDFLLSIGAIIIFPILSMFAFGGLALLGEMFRKMSDPDEHWLARAYFFINWFIFLMLSVILVTSAVFKYGLGLLIGYFLWYKILWRR